MFYVVLAILSVIALIEPRQRQLALSRLYEQEIFNFLLIAPRQRQLTLSRLYKSYDKLFNFF